jgi:hypothetical protein
MRQPRLVIIIALLIAISLVSAAIAQVVTIEQFVHPQTEKDMSANKSYFNGIKDGLVAYNMAAEEKLLCLPEASNLTFERASEILIRWSRKRGTGAASLPLGLSLLQSLEEAFLCANRDRK